MNKMLRFIERQFMKLNNFVLHIKNINASIFYGSFIFIICLFISTFWGEEILKKFEVLDTSIYNTVINLVPGAKEFLSSTLGEQFVIFLFICSVVLIILREFYKKVSLLIAHTTMGHDLSKIDKEYKKEYYSKKVDMTKISIPKVADDNSIIKALTEIDKIYSKYKNTAFSEIFYYGVSHIPLVFRLGYQFGQSRKIQFLHRFRKNESDQEFKVLPEQDDTPPILTTHRIDEENIQGNHDELIVAISTTYPIKKSDINILDKENQKLRYIYDVEESAYSFDYFSSMKQMQSCVNRLVSDMRRLIKKYNISTMHILISSSVPFTFYFAQQLNTQQFPKIIVYQYENQKYTWGIDITEKNPEKAIVRINENLEHKQ